MIDLADLLVDRVLVHPMPRKEPKVTEEQQEPLVLSEGLSPMTDALRQYVNLRVRGTLQSEDKAFDVVFDDPPSDTARDIRNHLRVETLEEGILADREDALVQLSQRMARRLFDVQPPPPPPSLFAVCAGSIRNRPALAVMKLEHEKGVTAEETLINARRTYQMTVEEQLVLVSGTRVFKAALFTPVSRENVRMDPEGFPINGRLSDNQNPFTAGGVATYFLRGFLGLKLEAEPRVQTEQVFKSIETFINAQISDPAQKVAAERALLVEMSSTKNTFSATSWANQHLTPETRAPLRQRLRQENLPTGGFPKDTDLVRKRLNLMSLELEGRISVVAPQERFEDETITVGDGIAPGEALVTIRAGLRKTRSSGR